MFEVTYHGDAGRALQLRYDYVDGNQVEECVLFNNHETARHYAIDSACSLLLAVVEVYIRHKKKLAADKAYGFPQYQDTVEYCVKYLKWVFPHPYKRCCLEVARITDRMSPFFERIMPFEHYPSYPASVKHLALIKTLSQYLITELQ